MGREQVIQGEREREWCSNIGRGLGRPIGRKGLWSVIFTSKARTPACDWAGSTSYQRNAKLILQKCDFCDCVMWRWNSEHQIRENLWRFCIAWKFYISSSDINVEQKKIRKSRQYLLHRKKEGIKWRAKIQIQLDWLSQLFNPAHKGLMFLLLIVHF